MLLLNVTGKFRIWSVWTFPSVIITYMPANARLVLSPILSLSVSYGVSWSMVFLTVYFFTLGICALFLCPHYYKDIWFKVVHYIWSMIGNILFKFPWSMFIWRGLMLPHVGIQLKKLYLSYYMHCWSYVICPCKVVNCCFPRVISIIQFFCP